MTTQQAIALADSESVNPGDITSIGLVSASLVAVGRRKLPWEL